MLYHIARQTDSPLTTDAVSSGLVAPSSALEPSSSSPSSSLPSSTPDSSSSSQESSSEPHSSQSSSTPSSSESPLSSQIPSSSDEHTPTTQKLLPETSATSSSIITTVVTSLNGQLTTYTSSLPTALVGDQVSQSNVHRTALIAGITSSLIVLLLLLLASVFVYRRHKVRRQMEVMTTEKKRKEGNSLLAGEGFDDDEDVLAMRAYEESLPIARGIYARPISPTPSMIRSRASEMGSIFREEVWPPPVDDLVDPISKGSSQVDLSRIVDDVMGPTGVAHDRRPTDSTLDSTDSGVLHDRYETDTSMNHGTSGYSNSGSISSSYTDPFRSRPTSNAIFGLEQSSSSFPQDFLRRSPSPPVPPPARVSPTILSPVHRSMATQLLSSQQRTVPITRESASTSILLPTTRSPPASITKSTQPKRSSPLARALTHDAKLWLSRSPHPGTTGAGHQP